MDGLARRLAGGDPQAFAALYDACAVRLHPYHGRREPLLFIYLVTAVCSQTAMGGIKQMLQEGPVSPAARTALDAELALHDNLDGQAWALRTERAFSLSSPREMPGTSLWLTRGFANDLMLRMIEVYEPFLKETLLPYAEVVSEQNKQARACPLEWLESGHSAPRSPLRRASKRN